MSEQKWALDIILPTIEVTRSSFNLPRKSFPKSSFFSPIESLQYGIAFLTTSQASKEGGDHHLMIQVLPAPRPMAPHDFRDFAFKEIVKGARDKKYSDYKQIPVASYKTRNGWASFYGDYGIDPPAGVKLTSRNLEAYFVKDGICATLTFTANSIGREDEELFYSLVDSVTFVDVSNPTTSFDYYQRGRVFQAHKDFRSAAQAFSSALKLERNQPELTVRRWQHLILDAAEVNQALSNWTEAREALEYGLSREPQNTFFLMQLARTYASQADEPGTLKVLEKAFFYMRQQSGPLKVQKSGVTVEWYFPDLSKNPAFKELMKSKSFREGVSAIKKANSK